MRVLITGGMGFIGSNLVPLLKEKGWDVVTVGKEKYDLTKMSDAEDLLREADPDVVYHLAAKVGGILANKTYPADFIYTNLAINTNFLEAARRYGVEKLIYTFCGCSYGKNVPNPIKEEYLFEGKPDENAMFYSIAKATSYLQLLAYRRQYGVKWVAFVPGNAYGPHDNFHPLHSHVIPALIRRFHEAKMQGKNSVIVWGTGKPTRDFIYVGDVARALMKGLDYDGDLPINISSGRGISIKELVEIIKEVVGFEGEVVWDTSKPDGHMVKIFDVSRMRNVLGFEPHVGLRKGLELTYKWFLEHVEP